MDLTHCPEGEGRGTRLITNFLTTHTAGYTHTHQTTHSHSQTQTHTRSVESMRIYTHTNHTPTKPLGSGRLSVSVVNSPVLKAQILTQQSTAPLRMNLSFSDRDRDLAVRGQGRTDGDGERERERER